MNNNYSLYDPFNREYNLDSLTPTFNPSVGVEIEASLIRNNCRAIISDQDLPDSFDYEVDPNIVEFNGSVLDTFNDSTLDSYMRSNLNRILEFSNSIDSIVAPFGLCPLKDHDLHTGAVASYLENHPCRAYRFLMNRDAGLTTLLTGSSSVQCHIQQNNYDAIVSQNIAHAIFAPYLVRLFANSIVFNAELTSTPSNRMSNKLGMNFAGSLEIEQLIAGPNQARRHFIEVSEEMDSISPGYFLVRYFRPDLGTIENCTADFPFSINHFNLFVRLCREISLISLEDNFIRDLLSFNSDFGCTDFLNFTTMNINNVNYSLENDKNFQFLLSTLSDFNLASDVNQILKFPQWSESIAYLNKFGVNFENPRISDDIMGSYIEHFYSILSSSIN